MTIALHVMTKNGREKLPALFRSVADFVDRAMILDTGSRDGTIEWLEKQTLLPALVDFQPFEDFGTTRTYGMEFAKGANADWILLLDDDMTLHCDPATTFDEIKTALNPEAECYMLQMDQPVTYWTTRLVRGDRNWRYVGVTHEYLDRTAGAPKLEGLSIQHHQVFGSEKFERDARLLAADIARDPNNSRTIFYLAQTFRDMGHKLPAIRFYEMRAKMGGWDEEVYYAMYEAARLANDPGAMEKVFDFRPSRAEPAAWLARYFKKHSIPTLERLWEHRRKEIPFTKDILFINKFAYGNLS